MYQFEFIIIGKQKPGPEKELMNRYQTYLTPYAKTTIHTIPESSFSSSYDQKRVLKKEEDLLLRFMESKKYLIVLDAKGKQFSSETFADQLQKWSCYEQNPLTFIIGGPLGLSEEIKKRAHILLSLSPMTFPHDVSRVLLAEQLYRAMTVMHRKTYHY